ncbi:helix-turn-helix domain-containing protein [Leifsonia sp. NPDC102414]|uniref:helix-turn-helix domain-containing protein n=1 Tax=Leifsonia sp. NPDC102414 TaxID=3364124 RepID=UPI00380431FA
MSTLPGWIDPASDDVLTPNALRGLANPIRLQLLDLLQADGPATATGLGERLGLSTGVLSYHLRVLAEHGFIVEDSERGTGRDRWWKAAKRSTSFTFRMPEDADGHDTAGATEQAAQFLRLVAEQSHRRTIAFIDSVAGQVDELAESPWTVTDLPLRLTPDEARALRSEVQELLVRYRRDPATPDAPGTVRAHVAFQLVPESQRAE